MRFLTQYIDWTLKRAMKSQLKRPAPNMKKMLLWRVSQGGTCQEHLQLLELHVALVAFEQQQRPRAQCTGWAEKNATLFVIAIAFVLLNRFQFSFFCVEAQSISFRMTPTRLT